jgi:hypothetical protein
MRQNSLLFQALGQEGGVGRRIVADAVLHRMMRRRNSGVAAVRDLVAGRAGGY